MKPRDAEATGFAASGEQGSGSKDGSPKQTRSKMSLRTAANRSFGKQAPHLCADVVASCESLAALLALDAPHQPCLPATSCARACEKGWVGRGGGGGGDGDGVGVGDGDGGGSCSGGDGGGGGGGCLMAMGIAGCLMEMGIAGTPGGTQRTTCQQTSGACADRTGRPPRGEPARPAAAAAAPQRPRAGSPARSPR